MFSITFETEECSRCNGTGHHQYNMISGSRCFKCRGAKLQLTRKGKTAKAAYDALIAEHCMKRADELVIGEKVFRPADGFMFARSGWYEITKSEADTLNPGYWKVGYEPGKNGARGEGTYLHSMYRFENREKTQEIMQTVAAKYKGATLVEK